MYFAHFFEHPAYGMPDSINKVVVQDINGMWLWQDVRGVTR
jgi:hypothetical protein